MVMLEFSIFPVDKGESLSAYVARCLDVVDKSGVEYRTNPMGTVLEGEWDEVFSVIKSCYQELRRDCRRITITIKVDAREDRPRAMEAKIRSVERKLGRELRK